MNYEKIQNIQKNLIEETEKLKEYSTKNRGIEGYSLTNLESFVNQLAEEVGVE